MARPIRIEFANAVYHVMARGNERREIFFDDQDRRAFLQLLAETVGRFNILIHAYCLMPNHYHLMIETPDANLSQAVGWLQVSYAVRFNRRHKRDGHLFQGRFKSHLIDPDSFGPALVRYLHVNPIRPRDKRMLIPADRLKGLDGYEWSSHRDYAGIRKPPRWLCVRWLRFWGSGASSGQGYRAYLQELSEKPVVSPWSDLRGDLVLGTEALWERARHLVLEKSGQQERRWEQNEGRENRKKRLARLISDEDDTRVRVWARARLGGERMIDIAHELGYADGSSVTQVVRRLENASQKDPVLSSKMNHLKDKMSFVKS